MPRAYLSVTAITGQIVLHTPAGGMGLSRREACALLRELAWAVEASAREEKESRRIEAERIRALKQTYGDHV